jgi:hypothetical protein
VEKELLQITASVIKTINEYMTGVTSEAGTVYPHGAPEFTPLFSGLCVALSLVAFVLVI